MSRSFDLRGVLAVMTVAAAIAMQAVVMWRYGPEVSVVPWLATLAGVVMTHYFNREREADKQQAVRDLVAELERRAETENGHAV